MARTDSLILGWEEAMTRAKEFKRIGDDAVFVEALPDKESMRKANEEIGMPCFANIIEVSFRTLICCWWMLSAN